MLGFRDVVMSPVVVLKILCVAMILCATGEARANVLEIHDLQIGGPTKMEILPNPSSGRLWQHPINIFSLNGLPVADKGRRYVSKPLSQAPGVLLYLNLP